jgi:hypothetical protein
MNVARSLSLQNEGPRATNDKIVILIENLIFYDTFHRLWVIL